MTDARRLLFVLGCVVCLLTVATSLPAADPRLDPPGAAGGEPIAGEWDAIDSTPDFSTDANGSDQPNDDENADNDGNDRNDDNDPASPDIVIDGAIEPGNEVTIDLRDINAFSRRSIEVNGEEVTEADHFGRADVVVPYAEEMHVAVPEDNLSRTVDVETAATITSTDGAVPAREYAVSVAVGSTPVANATVSVDGEDAAITDENGEATVVLPETAGPVDLRVDRGPVEGERTVEVAEPTVRFASPLLFPGGPAPVQVTADGAGVDDATVSLGDGETHTTGSDGTVRVWLPVEDEVTVTADVGAETATATVGNLYRRLAVLAVLIPGFAIGGTVTYLRFVATRDRHRGSGLAAVFVALADVFAGLSDAFAALAGLLRGRRRSMSIPELSLPRLRFGWTFPSIGASLSSAGGALGTLPSFGSLFGSPGRGGGSSKRGGFSLRSALFGSDTDDDDRTESGNARPTLAAEPLGPRGPRAEIREAWHAAIDRLGVNRRETATPGAIARRAIATGFPADAVTKLVAIVRDVEYGGREPSPDRVARAREAAADLIDSAPNDEEDDQ
ncbi:DUF4129 domain-containing protein [Halosolutus gelatinilyticus]|uniref:DUF4129 domain-containing protein n=1 Tax=Halosolutus gelatinilyticus TaxID=2931975 RepID=UPI001FF66810|nr:DUF4129 domain-containing protein [Halosolutus gelatinilyticus]